MTALQRLVAGVMVIATLGACTHAPSLATTLDAARTALWRGDLIQAQALADKAVALTKTVPGSVDGWTAVLLRTEVQLARLDLASAEPVLAAAVPAGASFDGIRSRQLYLVARALVTRGRLAEALEKLEAAAPLAPASDPLQMDIGVLTGQVRLRLGRWDEAEAGLRESLARAEGAGDRYRQALVLNNLGLARRIRNRWDEALPFFEGVLALDDLERFTVYGAALTNAGMCYSRLGQFDRAIPMQQRSVAKYAKSAVRGDYERALGELGNTYVLQGDQENGRRFLQQALDVATDAKIPADAALWAGNLASEYLEIGDWDRADALNARALEIRSAGHAGSVVHNTLNAARIAEGRSRSEQADQLYRAALAHGGQESDVLWEAHAGLASVAAASGKSEEANAEYKAALDVIDRTRSELVKTDYKLSFLTQLIHFYESYVDLLVQTGQADRALEVA
ncbi:MAG TPA: tetratricopeptide repeat protein, partial [Vicinamibacterales bacterium]|nr:tetratricopeptide repeat protein [Vicinamibacterales bacterium]